jgi:hypothetical protein
MKMLGHQHPSEQAEILLPAKLIEGSGKMGAETVGIKQAGAAVGAGGYEMQMIQSVVMLLPRHRAILHPETAHIGKFPMYAPPAAATDWLE